MHANARVKYHITLTDKLPTRQQNQLCRKMQQSNEYVSDTEKKKQQTNKMNFCMFRLGQDWKYINCHHRKNSDSSSATAAHLSDACSSSRLARLPHNSICSPTCNRHTQLNSSFLQHLGGFILMQHGNSEGMVTY